MWDQAEEALRAALEANRLRFEINSGDGAFYGPKIDFLFRDALRREWQLTTIQLDYAQPERFDLTYVSPEGKEARPVMIHRALLGSIERFMAILLEHCAGDFPLWLAPVQVRLITVTDQQHPYAERVLAELRAAGLRAEADLRNEKLGYKIREAQLAKVPVIAVVGEREAGAGTIAPRRENASQEALPLDTFVAETAAAARVPGGVP